MHTMSDTTMKAAHRKNMISCNPRSDELMSQLHYAIVTWVVKGWTGSRGTRRGKQTRSRGDGWMAGLPDPPSPVSIPPSVYYCPAETKGITELPYTGLPCSQVTSPLYTLTHPTHPEPKLFLHDKSLNSNTQNVHTARYTNEQIMIRKYVCTG